MQPNRLFPPPGFPPGLRRAVPMYTAPPGYDISIRNAVSARPNELIYHRLPARPPGPPVVITLDSDEEDGEPVTKKARKSTNEVDPEDVIFLDSGSEVSDSDSDDVIHIETINRSRMDDQPRRESRPAAESPVLDDERNDVMEAEPDSDDDVIHVQTITYSRVDDKSRKVGADANNAVEPKPEPTELPESSHKKDEVLGNLMTPLADKSERPVQVAPENPAHEDEMNDVLEFVPEPATIEHMESSHEDTGDEAQAIPVEKTVKIPVRDDNKNELEAVPEPEPESMPEPMPEVVKHPESVPEEAGEKAQTMPVQVAPENPVLEDKKNHLEVMPESQPEPETVEHPESNHEDTRDEDRAMAVQENPSETLEVVSEPEPEPESSESENRPVSLSPEAPETGAEQDMPTTLYTDGSMPELEPGHKENQGGELTPDISARTEPDRDVLVEIHHENPLPNASAFSELGPVEQSESENKENQENQDADTSDNASPRILRSRIPKTSPSQPAKAPEASIYANKKIREGPDYQTVMQPLLEDVPPSVHYDKPCEERIWSPRISEKDLFIEKSKVVYWKAIWRQFKGRILFEDALQHLMENDYDFAASLETIDQVLKKRPNLMRHPCMAQATRLATHGLKETVSMRKLRKLALPNFQLLEVHHYSFKFLNLCFFSKFYDSKCVCEEALCQPMDFEPRYGCSNCTKRPIEGNPLCLICQTYQQITGEKRPARDVYFTDEEKELIGKWEQMEEQRLGRCLTREEFEKLLEKEKVKKWMKLEITEEEKLMLNFQHPKTAESYSRMSNKVKAKNFVYYLKPFVLPLFPACKCDQSKERKLMIEKEHLFVPEIPNAPEFIRGEEFNPWVDG